MFRSTFLLHRLRGPRSYNLAGTEVQAHHVFGNAALGLSKDAWKILDQYCTLDYMGAAEYEAWGGQAPIARGLSDFWKLGEEKKLKTFAFVLGPHERPLNYARTLNNAHRKKKPVFPPAKFVTLFGICPEDTLDLAFERTRELIVEPRKHHIKSGNRLTEALDPISEYEREDPFQGWFELTNWFMFFSDQKMWEGFCELLGAEKCAIPPVPEVVDYTQMDKGQLADAAFRLGMTGTITAARKLKKPELLSLLMGAQEKSSEPAQP